ncbi:hypothetical protein [Ramlibacter sp.]|uniref:hypothetical protein n=1 Tax=Ramlibacter sp. TaxID=1917967 RepID=UPI003D0FF5E5
MFARHQPGMSLAATWPTLQHATKGSPGAFTIEMHEADRLALNPACEDLSAAHRRRLREALEDMMMADMARQPEARPGDWRRVAQVAVWNVFTGPRLPLEGFQQLAEASAAFLVGDPAPLRSLVPARGESARALDEFAQQQRSRERARARGEETDYFGTVVLPPGLRMTQLVQGIPREPGQAARMFLFPAGHDRFSMGSALPLDAGQTDMLVRMLVEAMWNEARPTLPPHVHKAIRGWFETIARQRCEQGPPTVADLEVLASVAADASAGDWDALVNRWGLPEAEILRAGSTAMLPERAFMICHLLTMGFAAVARAQDAGEELPAVDVDDDFSRDEFASAFRMFTRSSTRESDNEVLQSLARVAQWRVDCAESVVDELHWMAEARIAEPIVENAFWLSAALMLLDLPRPVLREYAVFSCAQVDRIADGAIRALPRIKLHIHEGGAGLKLALGVAASQSTVYSPKGDGLRPDGLDSPRALRWQEEVADLRQSAWLYEVFLLSDEARDPRNEGVAPHALIGHYRPWIMQAVVDHALAQLLEMPQEVTQRLLPAPQPASVGADAQPGDLPVEAAGATPILPVVVESEAPEEPPEVEVLADWQARQAAEKQARWQARDAKNAAAAGAEDGYHDRQASRAAAREDRTQAARIGKANQRQAAQARREAEEARAAEMAGPSTGRVKRHTSHHDKSKDPSAGRKILDRMGVERKGRSHRVEDAIALRKAMDEAQAKVPRFGLGAPPFPHAAA